jgi:hypothetical protein
MKYVACDVCASPRVKLSTGTAHPHAAFRHTPALLQLNKEHLLAALCKAFNLDMHVHHAAKSTVIDKSAVKQRIRELKTKRGTALQGHDFSQLHAIRHEIHELKRSLRKVADAK